MNFVTFLRQKSHHILIMANFFEEIFCCDLSVEIITSNQNRLFHKILDLIRFDSIFRFFSFSLWSAKINRLLSSEKNSNNEVIKGKQNRLVKVRDASHLICFVCLSIIIIIMLLTLSDYNREIIFFFFFWNFQ